MKFLFELHRSLAAVLDGRELLAWGQNRWTTDGSPLAWFVLALMASAVLAGVVMTVWKFARKDQTLYAKFPRTITVEHNGQLISAVRFWDPLEGYGYPCPVQSNCKILRTTEGFCVHLQSDHRNYGRVTSEAVESE